MLQKQRARIRALRLRRTANRPKSGSVNHGVPPQPAARSNEASTTGKRGRSVMTESAAGRRLPDSFLEALDLALYNDGLLAKRIAAAVQAVTESTQDKCDHTGSRGLHEPLTSVLRDAAANLGPTAKPADVEHLACLLNLADAGTADAVVDAVR